MSAKKDKGGEKVLSLGNLDKRQELILYAVVHEHVLTAEPVGSRKLVDKYGFSVSPATVRSEMALLEEEGYLIQPHTSAGRMPTDKGYRYYVDSLMRKKALSSTEERSIHHFYSLLGRETDGLMRATSSLLSKLTSYISIVFFAPFLAKSTLKHLDLVLLKSQAVLMVLITDAGQVIKRVLEVEEDVDASFVSMMESLLNKNLNGISLDQIPSRKKRLLAKSSSLEKSIIDKVIAQVTDSLAEEERESIFLGGKTNLLEQPEFENIEEIKKLLTTLEEEYVLLNLLEGTLKVKQLVVRIGSENREPSLDHCSLVASVYQVGGEAVGSLGILGPTRMNYERAIPAVRCIAKNLSEVLESSHS